ncbi:MAG: DUF4405 domain-containing protein [Atopobiaceae bacterium]|nr:DUF4405 domain-containing protein [Atopobiaceae bacterium]
MKRKTTPRWARPVIDGAMTLVYLLQMAPYQMGQVYHEWAGLSFVALFVAHHALNAGWLRRARKHGTTQAHLTITLDVALTACVTGIALSGILMSKKAVPALTVTSLAHFSRPLHACLTHLGLMLISLHVGMHAPILRGYARRATGRKLNASLSPVAFAIVSVSCLAAGAWAFMRLGVMTKLTMGMSFPDGTTPLPVLVMEHLLLASPFVLAGALLSQSKER